MATLTSKLDEKESGGTKKKGEKGGWRVGVACEGRLQTDQRDQKVRKVPRLNSKQVTAPERLRTVPACAPRGEIRESRKS